MTVLSAVLMVGVAALALRARKRPVVSGREEMIGMIGEIVESDQHTGWANVHGELWRVESATPLAPGERVRVSGLSGLTLRVTPLFP